jgi:twin BRCT domain
MAPQKTFKFKGASRRPASSKSSGSFNASQRSAPNQIQSCKAAPKNDRPLKAIFRGKVISVAGNIMTAGKKPTPITYESIAKWITLHGGNYEREVNESTTHLICSIEEYKKGGQQGKYLTSTSHGEMSDCYDSPKSLEIRQEAMPYRCV